MNSLIKCVGIALTIVSCLQCALAVENTIAVKNTTATKKEALDIRVTNAFVYVPLGNSKTTTGFFTVSNHSNSDISITGVTTSLAKQIKLMPKAMWAIPAHDSLALKPNGYFLQINELKTTLTTGDELHLTVSLSSGQKLQIIAVAKSAYDQIHGH